MLIENAIKHNVVSRQKPLSIRIQASGEQLLVRNNLQLRQSTEPSGRIGLQNIVRRYRLVSGRDVEIRRSESAFEVELPLLAMN